MLCGKYFPRFNLLLLDGSQLFGNAFSCFLEKIYNLKLFCTDTENNVSISLCQEAKTLLETCLESSSREIFAAAKDYISLHKIYCNTVIYFNLKYLEESQEIYSYLDRAIIYKHINLNIKKFAKKKMYFYADANKNIIFDHDSIITIALPTGKIKETLNVINFNLS